MALGEELIEHAERDPRRYAVRVRLLAATYVLLDAVCVAIIVLILWRGRVLITLAQRANVESLLLAILLALATFYLATTLRGAYGALRMARYDLPALWSRDRGAIERRKQAALRDERSDFAVHFDKRVCRDGASSDEEGRIRWELRDEAGSLGAVEIDGATATAQARKHGLHGSLLAFVLEQIVAVLEARGRGECLTIAFWSNIDTEGAAVYRSATKAFDALCARLGGPPLWPTVCLTEDEIEHIGRRLRAVVPSLRAEALLPDVEYEVEYTVPVLPEPLAFLQLRRSERRGDPVLTMGYALVVMLLVLVVTAAVIAFPPWVPAK